MNQQYFFILLFLSLSSSAFSQERHASLYGRVSAKEETIPGAHVQISDSNLFTQTGADGTYRIELQPGHYKILFTAAGFKSQTVEVDLKDNTPRELNIKLAPSSPIDLKEVSVRSKSAIEQVKESPFNVVALDAKSKYNTTLDLGHLLAKASGVKIRESGGVGGDMNITLNGFTGRNVKIFMDGVPMQGNSSSFQLNNIPVSLAERIEVYKGVVPVEFGGDAIGGAINIVTNRSTNTFLDASYSYGSFNTHRSNIIVGHTTPKGFSFQLNAYQTYSDNDYKIKSRLITNGQYSRETYEFRRFHAAYHNETVVAKAGVVNKSWADRFFIGAAISQDHQEVQNAPANIEFVYGEVETSRKGFQPNLEYYKRDLFFKGLTARVSANYNINSNKSIDTSSYKYNWLGEKAMAVSKGERGTSALSEYDNENYSAMANISYEISPSHSFTINDVQTGSKRYSTSTAPLELVTEFEKLRRLSYKNVLGVSYRFRQLNKWNVNVFAKNYFQKVIGPYNAADEAHPEWQERDESYNTTGYGIASTYFWKYFQFKASMERAYRLPSDNELFGDENAEVGNSSLVAENSMNYNLGFTINKEFQNTDALYVDANGYFRDTDDFIKREILVRTGTLTSVNFGSTRNLGVDLEARYYFRNIAMIGGTFTAMHLYDNEKFRGSEGTVLNSHYKDRMPNIPYQFGNLDAAYYIHNIGKKESGNVLNLEYSLNYVDQFYLNWESLGGTDKYELPTQLSHDFSATYSMKRGKYNFSLEVKNITDEELADNFGMMKPGRAFYGKIRIYLMHRGRHHRREQNNN
ncbi:outer membrane receptor protein involved in Fe transport [Flavobacterium nitrogenifigens]|uniref:Outer membrane receptor protein involved in Fe transport n=2 Tax=Flavobacterium TaxID=237 RepID=A0A7W7IWY2_9FLAO|nr:MULTISPECIES: TonB-dependent receptor [Flavobacterium]MBB4802124.1 outer membrane receptor protein involved in Fe transport [Flavobacterium nitrogenifigens]MBB6387082.1 outer membrane receptor protein involved in Fe transport [Flavobacterium notoginsengisoli]